MRNTVNVMPQIEEKTFIKSEKVVELNNDLEAGSDNDIFNEDQPKATNFLDKIGLRYGAEVRGIERVSNESRQKTSFLLPLTMFMSPNLAISAISTGALGPTVYQLDFWTCVLVIIFWSIIGALPVGLFAIFGAKFGLRQQILSRYFTGGYVARIFSFFNLLSCIGWNAVNCISSATLLGSLGVPPAVGCVIIAGSTCVIAFFGYKTVHLYERYSWIPNMVIYLVVIARLTISHNFSFGSMSAGKVEAGNVLSFTSLIFGFAAGWAPSAADYFVYMPHDTSSWKIFFCMMIGLSVPCIFSCILGAACAMGIASDPAWAAGWDKDSIGGLLYEILVIDSLRGFGKFCCVILALSTIANNLPGSYSLALSAQAIWSKFAKFPRLGWCLIGNFVSLAFAIPAYYVFEAAMSNFLSIISYNVSIYLGIALTEHFVYRRGFSGYDVSDFNDHSTVPIGIAGAVAFACGIVSTVLAMNQTWYQGVISQKFGEAGGDISFELNIAFTFISYNMIRPFEKKYFGR